MANRVERILEIPNAHIFYRNFSGVEKKYNPAGRLQTEEESNSYGNLIKELLE